VDDLATHKAFIDAIAENPDDDTARLVYADWLEARGDPRAEYLRLEAAWKTQLDRQQEIESHLDEIYRSLDREWLQLVTFDLWLTNYGGPEFKISAVRELRLLTGLGLKEALVLLLNDCPIRILQGLPRHEIGKRLERFRSVSPEYLPIRSQFDVRFSGWR
jgi:uncharacterized protein (TIGR02996 family)